MNCDDFVYVENVVHGHICAEKTLSTKEGSKISGGKVYHYYWIALVSLLINSHGAFNFL